GGGESAAGAEPARPPGVGLPAWTGPVNARSVRTPATPTLDDREPAGGPAPPFRGSPMSFSPRAGGTPPWPRAWYGCHSRGILSVIGARNERIDTIVTSCTTGRDGGKDTERVPGTTSTGNA